jgi:TfoX/Sxy family transcriptional regulator of competence genes
MPYREVPAPVLEDPSLLGEFMQAAVDVARRKKKAKKK